MARALRDEVKQATGKFDEVDAHTMKLLSIEANITQMAEDAEKKKAVTPGIKWLIVRNATSIATTRS